MPSSFMVCPRRCGLKCPLAHGKTEFRQPGTWVEPLFPWWAWCASSLVPLQAFAISVLYFLPHGMSAGSVNSLGFHLGEEQKDAPLARQPSLQVQPAPMRSAQHRVCACFCTLPACSSGTAPQSPQHLVISTFLQWEPSVSELWSTPLPSQIKELTVHLGF